MLKRLVDLPEEQRVAPEWVFERLREIDPGSEVLYMGDGVWWLGVVKPLAPRVEAGHQALKTYEKLKFEKGKETQWPIIRNAILKSQGFGLVGKYRWPAEPLWGAMIEEFRYADYMYRQYEDGTPEIKAQIEGVADEEAKHKIAAKMIETNHYDLRYLYKRLVRNNPAPMTVGANVS